MPSYKVLKPGFFGGTLYEPNGKRPVLYTEDAFPTEKGKEQVPSWLEAMGEKAKLTPAQKAARTKAAKAAEEKAASDAKDIEGASFMTEPGVETL